MKKYEPLLKHLVGNFGVEKLSKAIQRKGSNNVVDPQELYLPLLVVPRAILSWLVQNIKPMAVNELKELEFPGKPDIKIQIHKLNTDVYRGEMIQGGKVIHFFDKQTLPSIGGHLMTVGELYDQICDLDEKTPQSPSSVSDLVKEILKQSDFSIPKQAVTAVESRPELKALTDTIGKLVDALVAKHTNSEKKEIKKDELTPTEYKEPITDHELQRVKHPRETYLDHEKEKKQDPTIDRANPYNKAEMPGGAAMPKPPKPPQQAPTQTTNPSLAQQQTMASAEGKQQTPKPPAQPRGPGLANRPPGAGTTMKSGEKVELDPTKKPSKNQYFRKRSKTAKSNVNKSSDALESHVGDQVIAGLRNKLNYRKSENLEYTLSKEEVYNKCPFCQTKMFTEVAGKPQFTPCMCYTALTKTDDGKEVWFVKISKLEKGGYNLKFNSKVDPESIKAFLVTLKTRLLSKKGV